MSSSLLKSRNTANLVKVQRTVTRNGSTFTQNYWVNPSAVRSSDIVIGNKAVLDAYLKAQKANANAATQVSSSFDIATFDSLKSHNRDKALDYLKQCGITWKDNPNPAINWMHACMAAKAAANASSTQVPNNSTASGSGIDIAGAMSMLSKADQDTVLSCTTGKARVAAIKSAIGNAKTFEFARMAGVTWSENANAGINNMRMSMALAAAMDGYSSDSSSAPATKKVSAKPKSQPKKKKPKADPSAIHITKSMSPHKAAIAKILNDTSDKSVLQMYARTGIVAEDDTAKSFIENTLLPQYESLLQRKPWMDKDKSSGSTVKVPKSQKNLTDAMNSYLSIPGIKRDDKEAILASGATNITVNNIGSPSLRVSTDINQSSSIGFAIESIYNAFSTYATDDYDGSADDRYYTNLGYTGADVNKRKAQFDPKKDGFLRYLDHLEEQQPSLQPRINEMRTKYVNLLNECNYDPTLIKDMLNLSYVPTKDTSALYEALEQSQHNYYGVTYHRIINPQYIEDSWGWDAQYRKKVIDDNVDVILNNLRDRGITGKAAFHTLVSGYYGYGRIYEYDENGNSVRTKNGSISILDTADFVDKNGKKIADHNYVLSTTESLGNTPLYYTNFAIVKLLNTELSDKDKKELAKKGAIPRYIDRYERQYNTLASHIGITQDKVDKVTLDVIDMLNLRVRDKDGHIHDKVTVADLNTNNASSSSNTAKITRRSTQAMAVPMDNDLIGATILSNIYNTSNTLNTIMNFRRVANNSVPLKSATTSNDSRFDRQKVFRFYLPTNELLLADHHAMFASVLPSTRMSPSLVYIPDTKVSAKDINSAVEEQLSTFPTISDTTVLDCKQYTHSDTSGKYLVPARSLSMGELYDMPICSVISNTMQYIASRGSSGSASQKVSKVFIKPIDTKPKSTADNDMLRLRKDALKKVHCSISTEDAATSQKMREEMVSQFDFDGEKMNHHLYHNSSEDRRLLFNSSFFKINNSTMENDFKKRADELAPQGIKPEEMVHGTGYGNAVGILGRSGGWMLNGKNQTSGAMLGNGAYFGRSVGKSIVYVSSTDNSYSCLRHDGNQGDNANGIIIQASVLRDPGHYREDGPGSSNSSYHGIKAYEAVINSNNDILPHHIVAVSGRDLKAGNVTRDSKGNYVDPDTGQVLWDRSGMRVDNKTTGSHTR